MKFDKSIFDHGRRHFELIEALGTFRQLQNFADDQDALRAHLNGKGRPKTISSEGEIEGIEDKEIERFLEPLAESIETAISNYRRQLLVVIVSIVEATISDVFTVLFTFKPEAIKGLSKDSNGEGFIPSVSVDDLMQATQLDELRSGVVERAVAYACQGKNRKTVLRRISRLFGTDVPETSANAFLDLSDRRNQIVHENSKAEVTTSQVEDAFEVSMSFIQELGKLVSSKGLPIYDPLEVCRG